MEFNFIKVKSNGAYVNVIDKSNKTRFLSFTKKQSATDYLKYLCKFRANHGYWFRMDFSRDEAEKNNKIFEYKNHTPNNLEQHFDIDTFNETEFEKIYSKFDMNLLYCDEIHFMSEGLKSHIDIKNATLWDCKSDIIKYTLQLDNTFEKEM